MALNANSGTPMSYSYSATKQHPRFSPYADNGGTIVAIAGEDFAVIASDTRLSDYYSILTRDQSKLFKLSNSSVAGISGCWCDVLTFTRVIEARLKIYQHEHNKSMSTPAIAQLISTMLYYKRMFPYYVSTVLAGLDKEGKGLVYCYDPVGHCDKNSNFCARGASGSLIQSLLDNQIGFKNMENVDKSKPLSLEKAVAVIKDSFISATERDIHTGDAVIINIITKDGIKSEKHPLRQD